MSIVIAIIIGFVVGLVARAIMPGSDKAGIIVTTALGVGGSLLSTFVGQGLGLYQAGDVAGFIGAVVGAIILLLIWRFIRPKAPDIRA